MKQQRTLDRHALLVAAAADLLAEHGWAALTHRGLVARSGVPLASMTYYFDGVDDLVAQAAGELARRHLDRARTAVQAVPRQRAGAERTLAVVVEVLVGPAPTTRGFEAFYERYLRAGRSERLRPLVIRWNAETLDLVTEVLERTGRPATRAQVRLLVAGLDGLLVTALAEGEVDPVTVATRAAVPLLPA